MLCKEENLTTFCLRLSSPSKVKLHLMNYMINVSGFARSENSN